MGSAKTPNTALAALLAEAGMSNAGLAHRVNELAAARGLAPCAYNHASVARWLRGEHPRAAAPDLIADALSGALGRRITRADASMRPGIPVAQVGLDYHSHLGDALDAATDLYATDVTRRATLARSAYSAVAYAVPALRWMTAPASHLTERSGTRRVSLANADAIREVTAVFRRQDNQFGGGYARSTVVQYLADEVAPLLRHGAYTEDTGRALLSAAAEMTLLAGWMAYDLEQHPIAQRYLIQALRLAQGGADEALGAEILAAMSCQAAYLGLGVDAVDMARAAARSARRVGSGALLSECLAAQAHGHALAGAPRSCAEAIDAAQDALGAAAGDSPAWLGYYDDAYLAAKKGRALLDAGDPAQAVKSMRASLSMRDGFERGHAFNLTTLACALVDHGDLEEACAVADRAAGEAGEVNFSARAETELVALSRRLSPYAGAAPVRKLAATRPRLVSAPRGGRGRRAVR